MKLECYALSPNPLPLRAAPPSRNWMDRIPDRHAYRCLPLAIANAHGWEIACVCDFEAAWDGGPHARNVQLRALDGFTSLPQYVVTHFAFGIVTFHLTYLFRTEPGWNLVATGPTNQPKDGIAPLTGVIETDWLPYPFTMNWQMTRPGRVRFSKDEPICMVFPVQANAAAETEPVIRDLADNPELQAQAMAWKGRRDDFMQRFNAGDQATRKAGWQRDYFLGRRADGAAPDAQHVNKLRLTEPVDQRKR
ncbi:MAG TPA: DUF6065 family protein [Casimicrobiaceae bacterium]|nr:DUF6065 family protein [Casimicrobiaceae bacterium]